MDFTRAHLLIGAFMLMAPPSRVTPASATLRVSPAAGTYRFAVCALATPCSPNDSAHAYVWGYLVLSDTAFRFDRISSDARLYLDVDAMGAPINGCRVTHQGIRSKTHAGIGGVSGIHWSSQATGGVTLLLYRDRTPTNSYMASVRLSGDRIDGRGRSHGSAGMPQFATDSADTLVGMRVGPPDLSRCIDATRSQLLVDQRPHVVSTPPMHPDTTKHWLFYLSEGDTTEMIAGIRTEPVSSAADLAFRSSDVVAVDARREPGTDLDDYAATIIREIHLLIASGVPASSITVAGARTGAEIASRVSSRSTDPVGYVLIGGCATGTLQAPRTPVHFHGDVLSLVARDSGGAPADRCAADFAASPGLGKHAELLVDGTSWQTSLYRGDDEWIYATVEWAVMRRVGGH